MIDPKMVADDLKKFFNKDVVLYEIGTENKIDLVKSQK